MWFSVQTRFKEFEHFFHNLSFYFSNSICDFWSFYFVACSKNAAFSNNNFCTWHESELEYHSELPLVFTFQILFSIDTCHIFSISSYRYFFSLYNILMLYSLKDNACYLNFRWSCLFVKWNVYYNEYCILHCTLVQYPVRMLYALISRISFFVEISDKSLHKCFFVRKRQKWISHTYFLNI